MSDDIVHRLRNPNHWIFRIVGPKSGATVQGESDAPREAADEIERLRADLDAYQKERDGEVVRLRVELAKERERADAHYRALENVTTKNERLTAERDALRTELAAESILVEIADALTTAIRKERWDIVIHVRDAVKETNRV